MRRLDGIIDSMDMLLLFSRSTEDETGGWHHRLNGYVVVVVVVVAVVVQAYPTLCNPVDCSTLGFPVLHHLPDPAQTRALNW